jgi:hypothetical protein
MIADTSLDLAQRPEFRFNLIKAETRFFVPRVRNDPVLDVFVEQRERDTDHFIRTPVPARSDGEIEHSLLLIRQLNSHCPSVTELHRRRR